MSITGSLHHIEIHDPMLNDVVDGDRDFFERPWRADQWADLNFFHNNILTWQINGKLAGFALFGVLKGDEAAHLQKIMLLPEYRGSGMAAEFLMACNSRLKTQGFSRIFLEVETGNLRAIKFYEKMNFKRLRLMKSYYSDGADAYSMELTL